MDELFFYALRRVDDLIEEKDEKTEWQIRENLRAMCVAYEKQRNAAQQAKKWSAANRSSNKKRLTTND